MKRQSKAEEALHAQVKIIQGQMDEYDFQIKELQVRRATLFEMRQRFESDIYKMKKARKSKETLTYDPNFPNPPNRPNCFPVPSRNQHPICP